MGSIAEGTLVGAFAGAAVVGAHPFFRTRFSTSFLTNFVLFADNESSTFWLLHELLESVVLEALDDQLLFPASSSIFLGKDTAILQVGELITKVIEGLSKNSENNSKVELEVKNEVIKLCSKFPIYNHLIKN